MPEDHYDEDQTQSFVPLTKGTKVGHYKIISKIGAGGMGEVYLAKDIELDRKVALKFLPAHLCQDEDCRARFKREAQAAAKLDHPNIVPVHEVGEFQGRPYFAMARIKGESLRDFIKKGPITTDEAVRLTMQICDGLQKAHEKGIVHRDIKPSNIIVDTDGRARLVDFGLAAVKGTDKLTKTGSTLGTAGYMSPEQAEGKQTDQKSDLFSLGVVLYEMLTGRRPFDRENDVATGKAIITDFPEPLARYKSGTPGELQQIVDRALEKNPDTRYQTASGMLADLRRLGISEIKIPPGKKRVRKLTWIAAVLVLAIIGIWGGFQIKQMIAPGRASTKSIAVVDFDNIGSEEDAYLASGLAEDLAVKLRQLEGFEVASSADIRRLAKENLLPREIASRLKVQYALGGSLLREDSLVRVNVELIDKETGNVIWSEQINKQFTEIFQFMDDVSLKIVQALEVRLTPIEEVAIATKPTDNTEAYDHYLKGRHYYYNITFRDNDFANREFERALQLDGGYPLALAGLADTYVQRYKEKFDYDEIWLDSAKVLIDQALSAEPDLAEAHESLAEVLMEEDNVDGALAAAEKARELRPNWDEPYVHLGDIYRNRGERTIAVAMYDSALSIQESVDALCGRGEIFEIRGAMDSARAAYQAALKLNPEHDRPYLALGDLYQWLNEDEKADSMYRQAIEVRPDHVAGYQNVSDLLVIHGETQKGEAVLRRFVKQYPYNWDGYEALYDYVAWWKGDYPAALEIVEEAVTRNPKRAWPYLFLASSYAYKMSSEVEPDKAIQAVEQALALRPNSGRVLEWAGDVYASFDRVDEALIYYDKALEFRPGSDSLLRSIAGTLAANREYERAVEFAREAVKQAPGKTKNYSQLRVVLIGLNRWQEYYDLIRQAARDYGDDPGFLLILSKAQRLAGDFSEAAKSAQRARASKQAGAYGLAQLGAALWLLGDSEGALASFREVLNYFWTAKWVVSILQSEGRFNEIEQFLKSIKEPKPDLVSGVDYWAAIAGRYYMSLRRFDDALAVWSELRESGEETWSVWTLEAMAECYRQLGSLDSARYLLEISVDSSSAEDKPSMRMRLAKLRAIGAQNLTGALELASSATVDQTYTMGSVMLDLVRLQYACGKTSEAVQSLERVQPYLNEISGWYPAAQIADVTGSSNATKLLDMAVSRLTHLSRGDAFWADLGKSSAFRSLALARAGDNDEAAHAIEWALKVQPEEEEIAYHAACAYSLLGDTALALQWLETAVERGHLELWWARVDPDLDPLREIPRFKEIMKDWDNRIQAILAKSNSDN